MCPVCGKFYFEDPSNANSKYKRKEYLNGNVYCFQCGWIYDLKEIENPDSYIGRNEITLNQYIEHYNELIKLNPHYHYLDDKAAKSGPYMCPICGKCKFRDESTFDICPYCGWEDDGVQNDNPNYAGGANELSLIEYKKQYEEKIKEDPKYVWKAHWDD